MEKTELKRALGLGSAVSMIIGYTIGAGIFVLVGPLAFKTGPALWVTFLIASLPALFMCFTSAQLGSALPVAGANYVITSRTMGPFWGFMTVWSIMITTLIGVPLVAYSFAEYLSLFIPGLNPMWTAIAITLLFGAINLLGVSIMGWIQNIMVIIFIAAIVIFGIGGLFNINTDFAFPLFQNGISPVLMAAIPAYFSFVGFMVIVDLGEEIKNPSRNIPLALLLSFLSILLAYFIVSFTMTGVLPWESLKDMKGAMAVASKEFLPGWVTVLIQIGAILAAFTSINAILATSPREVFALARDKVFPGWLAKTGERFKAPYMAIIVVTLLSIGGILLGAGIVEYAFVTVMGIMTIHIFVAIGVLRLKSKLPDHYEKASFKLKGFWRLFWPIGVIVIGTIYILLGFVESPKSVGIFFGAIGLGVFLYIERRWRLKRSGIDIGDILEKDIEGVLSRALHADN
jgi:basic amino acid/polyamine antiporter, APA family